tara:strand:- start:115 stop:489 length:375 start_codon:yes stop_codon:yes gene_type:complete
MSIGIGQVNKKAQNVNIDTKKNSVVVSDFLEKELNLDKKQKKSCLIAYAEYANNLNITRKKLKEKGFDMKMLNQELMRRSVKLIKMRDLKIKEILSKKQFLKYNKETIKFINPLTLRVEKRSKI